MKTAAIPVVRVSPGLRKAAAALPDSGETVSGFVEDAALFEIENRELVTLLAARQQRDEDCR